MWKQFLVYMALYISITLIHDFVLSLEGFEYGSETILNNSNTTNPSLPLASILVVAYGDIATYCTKFVSSLQIVLLLGFFTSTAMNVSTIEIQCR